MDGLRAHRSLPGTLPYVLATALILLGAQHSAHSQDTDGGGDAGPAAVAQPANAPPDAEASIQRELHRTVGLVAWKRAALAIRADGYDRVIDELEALRAAGSDGVDTRSLFLLAHAYVSAGRASEGRAVIADARASLPDYVGLAIIDATGELLAERFVKAVEAADRIISEAKRLNADRAISVHVLYLAYATRALALRKLGRNDDAIADLKQTVDLSRKLLGRPTVTAEILLARSHVDLQEYGPAAKLLRDVLEREPGNARSYANVGLIHFERTELDEARRWYEEAIARDPSLDDAHERLAYIALRQQPPDLARMKRHLEAARDQRERVWKLRPDLQTRSGVASIRAGLGMYWAQVSNARADEGATEASNRAAVRAKAHLHAALTSNPDCLSALQALLQLLNRTGASDEEIEAISLRLQEAQAAPKLERGIFC